MKRLLVAAGLVAGLIAATALPAFAHAELDKKRVKAGEEIDLVLTVPSEIEGDHNAKVVLELPAGFAFRNCIATGNWACSLSVEPNPTRDVVTWAPVPGNDQGIETFQFRVEARVANGDVPFEVNQFYAGGKAVSWDGDADSENPAPVLTVFDGAEPDANDVDVKAPENHSDGGATVESDELQTDGEVHATDDPEGHAANEDGNDMAEAGTESDDEGANWPLVGLMAVFFIGSAALPIFAMVGTPSAEGVDHH